MTPLYVCIFGTQVVEMFELGGVALLENVCHLGRALRFQKTALCPSQLVCLIVVVSQDASSQLLFSEGHGLGPTDHKSQINPFVSYLGHGVLV